MEYVEMPTPPKAMPMLEKLLSNEALARMTGASYTAAGAAAGGYRTMPLPVFSHVKPASPPILSMAQPGASGIPASELSRRGGMPAFAPTTAGSLSGPLSHTRSEGVLGVMQLQKAAMEARSLPVDGRSEQKGRKNTREGGGRGSRGGGASRKRSRVGLAVDPSGAGGDGADGGFGPGAPATARVPSGTCHRAANGEKAEKTVPRKQTGQSAKRGEKKASQAAAGLANDTLLTRSCTGNGPPPGSTGILDIYCLKTKPIDLSRFMEDIPLNDLLTGNYKLPPVQAKGPDPREQAEVKLDQLITGILQFMPKRPCGSQVPIVANTSKKCGRRMLDLEALLQAEEDDGSGMPDGKFDREKGGDKLQLAAENEGAGDKEARAGLKLLDKANGSSSQSLSKFSVDDLPMHSLQEFMSRLQLPPSEPLEVLVAKAGVVEDTTHGLVERPGMSSVPSSRSYYWNRSIPPLPFSLPPVGPVKSEFDHEKGLKNGKISQRRWATTDVSKGSKGLADSVCCQKEDPEAKGGDSVSMEERSSNGRHSRRCEETDKSKMQYPMQICSPALPQTSSPFQPSGGLGPPAGIVAATVASSGLVKEEPRQVQNAIGLSSSGCPSDAMEIDSHREDTGAATPCVEDKPEKQGGASRSSVSPDGRQQPGSTNAMQSMDMQLSNPGKEAIDTQNSRPTPILGPAGERVGEADRKELAEGAGLAGPGVKSGFPVLEIKVQENGQCSSPRNDLPTSLPAMPCSPGAEEAAHLLCVLANSVPPVDLLNPEGDRDRRRRTFHPYGGAPTQRASKAAKNGTSGTGTADPNGAAGMKGGGSKETGSVVPAKVLVSERRKSLNQFNDTCVAGEKSATPITSARGGPSRVAGGAAVGPRSNHTSHRTEKGGVREIGGREGSGNRSCRSLSPAGGATQLKALNSAGSSGMKGGPAGAKNILFSSATQGRGAVTGFSKIPAAGNSQRVMAGVGAKTTRPHSNGAVISVSSGVGLPAVVPGKSFRPSVGANGEARQRTSKTEIGSVRGKSTRD